MKYTLALAMAMLCFVRISHAQEPNETDAVSKKMAEMSYDKPLFERPMVIALNLGTTGIGAEAKLNISPRFKTRLGVSVLPINIRREVEIEDVNTDVKLHTNVSKFQLLGEYRPFKSSSFRFVAGVLTGELVLDSVATRIASLV